MGIGAVNSPTEEQRLNSLPWLTRSRARPAARSKAHQLAKDKNSLDETDFFLFLFVFCLFVLGALTFLLS